MTVSSKGSPALPGISKERIFESTFELPPQKGPGPRPQKAKKPPVRKATQETEGQKAWQEGRAKGTNVEAPSRTNPSGGRSQEAGTPRVRPEEAPDAGAQGTTTPPRPGKAGRGQVPWAMQGLPEPRSPEPDQVRDLRRETPSIPGRRTAKGNAAVRHSGQGTMF